MKTIGILNGPNLDRLGKREPAIYGSQTLAQIEKIIHDEAELFGVNVDFFQSASEGALVEQIHAWTDAGVSGIIANFAAYTHTSIALHDAVKASGLPVIEVHLSQVYQREAFRHRSLTAPACAGVIAGLGVEGYLAALRKLAK